MATTYDLNYLRQIEAGDSEFNKAQKADNLHNMQANIMLNGAPEQQQTVQQQPAVPPAPAPVANTETPQPTAAATSDPAWYLKENNIPMKATQVVAQGSAPSFNAQAVTNAAVANLMKKGYSQDEATQMLSPYIMEWQNRERQDNKAKADDLMARMADMQYGSQDYYNAALQMYQLDPERGQLLLRGAVTPKDMWVRQNRLDDIADQRAYQQQLASMGLLGGAGRRGRAGGSGGGGGRGGSGGGGRGRTAAQYGGFTKTQYDMAGKMLTNLNKQISALQDAGKEVPDNMKRKAMALDRIISSYENGILGFGTGDESAGTQIAPGMTKEQIANGVQNVIWDDGLKYEGPSEDALNYLIEKTGASAGLLGNVNKALYNKAAAENQADAADFENDASLAVRQQRYTQGLKDAQSAGYEVDNDGTVINASAEFKNAHPELTYLDKDKDYFDRLLASVGDFI